MIKLFYAERRVVDVHCFSGELLVKAEARYPEFSTYESLAQIRALNSEYARRARTSVRAFVDESRRDAEQLFLERGPSSEEFPPFEYLQTFCATLLHGPFASLYFDAYRYTAGAHGTTVRAGDTFSVKTGNRLPLSALFPRNAPYEEWTLSCVAESIEARSKENPSAYFENSAELAKEAFHPANFYLSPGVLNVFYQQYDIAPYSTGIPVFSMDFSALCEIGTF